MAPHNDTSSTTSDKATPWCLYKSVLDISLECPEKPLPFEPPFGRYLLEVVSGLKAGPGDRSDTESRHGCSKVAVNVALLLGLLDGEDGRTHASQAAERACGLLFWICVGVVFSRAPYPQALAFLRSELARAWYLLALETKRSAPWEREKRDWLMDAWPFIFSQAIFRILYDAFEEDKDNLKKHSGDMLDKLSRVAHFEALGFQMDKDTARKARNRLFLRRVVQSPETDQVTFLQGLARRQLLETHLDARPLSFAPSPDGDNSQLDTHQLEDLWDNLHQGKFQGKERWRPKHADGLSSSQSRSSGKLSEDQEAERARAFLLEKRKAWAPAESLSVSRHHVLSSESDELYRQQMLQVADMLDNDSDETPGTANVGGDGSDDDLPPQPAINSITAYYSSPNLALVDDLSTPTTPENRGRARSDNLATETKSRWRKARAVGHISGMMSSNERKERQERERARRQRELSSKIAAPLPDEVRRKELCTTWVSPLTKGLCPDAQDRLLLKKRDAEAWRLKMTTNRRAMQTSVSVPALRRKERRTPPEHAQDALRCTSAGSNSGGGGARRATSKGGDSMLSSGGRPSLCKSSSGHKSPPHGQTVPSGGVETLEEVIDSSGVVTLRHNCIMQRLESQATAFQSGAFSEYMKTVNILTGERKATIDGSLLRREEDAATATSQALLGGGALKMNGIDKIIAAQAGAARQLPGAKTDSSRASSRRRRGH